MIRWFFRILALFVALYAIGFGLFAMTLPRPAGDERTDAIVVLTGGTGRLDAKLCCNALPQLPFHCWSNIRFMDPPVVLGSWRLSP